MIFTSIKFAVAIALFIGSSAVAAPMPGQLQARTGSFASLSSSQRKAAIDFIQSAPSSALLGAAAGGSSAKTFISNGLFHLDRQQPSSSRFQSKIALQLNKGSPSTVGQVVVPIGFNPPVKTIIAQMIDSINKGVEKTMVPEGVPAPRRPRDVEFEVRDFEERGFEEREFEERDFEERDLEVRDLVQLQARTGSFAALSSSQRKAAIDFIQGAPSSALLGAAAGGSSAKTFISNGLFHLDRQQPSSSRFQSKIALQLNRGSPSTVGQVVVPVGFNPPVKTIIAQMIDSINKGVEKTMVPEGVPAPRRPRDVEFEVREFEERGFEEEA